MIELLRDIARRCESGVSTVGKPEILRAVTQAADEIESLRKQLAAANRTLDETAPWREQQAENKRLQQQLAECERELDDRASPEMTMMLMAALATMTKERDELVAALKGLADWFDSDDRAPADRWLKAEEAALAKLGADKTGE